MFSRLQDVIDQGIEKNLHLGVQMSLSFQGEHCELAHGQSSLGVPLQDDTKMLWLSAGKPLTAVAILILQQRGCLSVDDPVSKYFPAFAKDGKEAITIAHFLTHTAGLEDVKTGWPHSDYDHIIERFCAAGLKENWIPGQRAAYSPSATWVLLGEIIARLTGMSFEQFVQKEILDVVGMQQTVFVHRGRSEEFDGQLQMYDRDKGDLKISVYVDRLLTGIPLPGSCIAGPASDLRKFYDTLRSDASSENPKLLNSESLKQLVTRHRKDLVDETFQHKIDFGLGVIMNSNRFGVKTVPYGYGENSSDEAFGHGGSQSSIGFADPKRELSLVMIANGRPGEGQHQRRFRLMLAALEEDLKSISRH